MILWVPAWLAFQFKSHRKVLTQSYPERFEGSENAFVCVRDQLAALRQKDFWLLSKIWNENNRADGFPLRLQTKRNLKQKKTVNTIVFLSVFESDAEIIFSRSMEQEEEVAWVRWLRDDPMENLQNFIRISLAPRLSQNPIGFKSSPATETHYMRIYMPRQYGTEGFKGVLRGGPVGIFPA